jgi:PAS domain-containing protein
MSNARLDNGEVTPTDWLARIRKLEEEVAGLRRALSSRGLIEQAKGIIAQQKNVSPEAAFKQLSERSQKRNIPVADLAAEVVAGLALPAEPGVRSRKGTHLQRAVSAAAATVSLPELAEALWQGGLAEAGAICVAIASNQDGKLRVISAIGEARQSVPELLAQDGQALYPMDTANGEVLLLMAFDGSPPAELQAVAAAVAQIVSRMWCPPAIEWDQLEWLRAMLSAVYGQGKLLTPVRDESGEITDFAVDYATREVTSLFGRSLAELTGTRLLDLEPHLVGNGIFAGYVAAFEEGVAFERPASYETVLFRGRPRRLLLRRRAVRVGGHLLVSQQHLDAAQRQNEYVARMEVLGRLGFAEWDLATNEISWSAGFYTLFGRDSAEGPSTLDRLAKLSDDLKDVLAKLRSGPGTADVTFQVSNPDGGVRWLRMLAEAKAIPSGEVHLVQAVASDITEEKTASDALRRSETALAGQRLRVAAEKELTRQMRELLYPASTLEVAVPGLSVRGQHWVPQEDRRLQADFLDAAADADGNVLMITGDIIGSGLAAAATMTRLMYPARVMARTGARPAEILAALNAELRQDKSGPMASVVIARYQPETQLVTWAQAGHLAPVLVRSGKARQLVPPQGVLLGLAAGDYDSQEIYLVPGDLLIFFTDGVAAGYREERNPMRPLLREMEKYALDGPGALLERFMGTGDGEACILIAQAL